MKLISEENGMIRLANGSFSYVMYVDGTKHLQHVYSGKDIGPFDKAQRESILKDCYYEYLSPEGAIHEEKDGYGGDVSSEVATAGLGDHMGSAIRIAQNDGSFSTEFLYVSHRFYPGLPSLKGLPYARENGSICESVEFLLKDALSGVEAYLTYSLFADKNVLLRNLRLVNPSKEPIRILRAASLELDLPGYAYDHLHFFGTWGRERFPERVALMHGTLAHSITSGRSSHEENPFNVLLEKKADETHGECYGFNLFYSGNWKEEITVNERNNTRVIEGINDENFSYELEENEEFIAPEGVILYSNEGLSKLSQTSHDFIRNNVIQSPLAKQYRPLLFNSWEGALFDFSTQSILSYMEEAKKIGTELFVLDDGWFGQRNDDRHGLGDWWVNTEKIDLGKVIAHCHELGMKFGLWFEPEMVNPDSDLFRKHPSWALGHPQLNRELGRHQFPLDLTNPEVRDNLVSQVNAILDHYAIDYVKWDYNCFIQDAYSSHLSKERQGGVNYLLVKGYYDLCERIVMSHPKIFFEGCASGGGRFDLGTLSYFPQIWCSDETDPAQRIFIQYGTSFGYPLSTMGSHVSISKTASYTTKSDLAFFGSYGYEFNPSKLSDFEKEELKKNAKNYSQLHKSLIDEGDLYRLLSPQEGNFLGLLSVKKDQSEALLLVVSTLKKITLSFFVKLPGLKDERRYRNDFNGEVHTGEFYRTVGINFSPKWFDEFHSELVHLKEE